MFCIPTNSYCQLFKLVICVCHHVGPFPFNRFLLKWNTQQRGGFTNTAWEMPSTFFVLDTWVQVKPRGIITCSTHT